MTLTPGAEAPLTLDPAGVFTFCSLRTTPGTAGAKVLIAGSGQTTINIVGTMRIADAGLLRSQPGVPAALINVGGSLVRVGRMAELDAVVTAPNATFRVGRGGHINGSFFMNACGTDKEVVCACDFIPPVPTTTTASTTTTTTL